MNIIEQVFCFENFILSYIESNSKTFLEDSKHDFEKYNYGNQYVKNLRQVDILQSKLKRGQISQEEFDKSYAKLSTVKDEYDDEYQEEWRAENRGWGTCNFDLGRREVKSYLMFLKLVQNK